MKAKLLDHLERHSLLLIGASMAGHVGNYLYHFITGRILPVSEYGLLMALFGALNVVMFPMSALQLSLTRAIAEFRVKQEDAAISDLLSFWMIRLLAAGILLCGGILVFHAWFFDMFSLNRWPPLLLASVIPCLALLLTLTGAGLQGLQHFRGLALRGSLMFTLRALLVGGCLVFGFAAAGWALLAHLLSMLVALGVSLWILRTAFTFRSVRPPSCAVLPGALRAMPILLAFSVLMTADVILVRSIHSEDLSGAFAQASTLGRMILWIPLPIAQALFPKVVSNPNGTGLHQGLLKKALLYTNLLVFAALAGAWILGPFIFELLYGNVATEQQIQWLRRMGVCMAFLGPVYVAMHYEMARHRYRKLIPICLFATVYVGSVLLLRPTPGQILSFLGVATAFSLVTVLRGLGAEPETPAAPSP